MCKNTSKCVCHGELKKNITYPHELEAMKDAVIAIGVSLGVDSIFVLIIFFFILI